MRIAEYFPERKVEFLFFSVLFGKVPYSCRIYSTQWMDNVRNGKNDPERWKIVASVGRRYLDEGNVSASEYPIGSIRIIIEWIGWKREGGRGYVEVNVIRNVKQS